MKKVEKKLIIANWKMSLNYSDSISLAKKLKISLKKSKSKNDILILPDFLSLVRVAEILKNTKILLGSQDLAPFSLGAYSGEVSLESLQEVSCSYVLIGHSERRKYFNDNFLIADKMKNVFDNSNIVPILCVGETWAEKKSGKTLKIIEQQLKTAFSKALKLKNRQIVIAYEPVWAIGSGKAVELDDAIIVHKKIKEIIFKNLKTKNVQVLYGGSVNLENYEKFKNQEYIDGLLMGGSSLNANNFIKIANNF